jgi:hypothetical protein
VNAGHPHGQKKTETIIWRSIWISCVPSHTIYNITTYHWIAYSATSCSRWQPSPPTPRLLPLIYLASHPCLSPHLSPLAFPLSSLLPSELAQKPCFSLFTSPLSLLDVCIRLFVSSYVVCCLSLFSPSFSPLSCRASVISAPIMHLCSHCFSPTLLARYFNLSCTTSPLSQLYIFLVHIYLILSHPFPCTDYNWTTTAISG